MGPIVVVHILVSLRQWMHLALVCSPVLINHFHAWLYLVIRVLAEGLLRLKLVIPVLSCPSAPIWCNWRHHYHNILLLRDDLTFTLQMNCLFYLCPIERTRVECLVCGAQFNYLVYFIWRQSLSPRNWVGLPTKLLLVLFLGHWRGVSNLSKNHARLV